MRTKSKFHVRILSVKKINWLPGSWSNKHFQKVLELADFENWNKLKSSELKDNTILTLQSLKPKEAAAIVFKYIFQNRLKEEQIQQMAQEMMKEKIREKSPDFRLHKKLYNCAVLLKWAFPNNFPETDARECRIEVLAQDKHGKELLNYTNKRFLTRLIARGMDSNSVINRLFDKQIAGEPFAAAEGIIWDFKSEVDKEKVLFTVYSSNYWFHDISDTGKGYSSYNQSSDLT
ncbi:MAG: hypothetical protein ACI8Q1_001268 [Parvicella sp.]|jgi:hypothetical protein